MMGHRYRIGVLLGIVIVLGGGLSALGGGPGSSSASAVERGRVALLEQSHVPPAWSEPAYHDVVRFWGDEPPDPQQDPEGFAAEFRRRYGLHPAPYPNDGLPMGLRKATSRDGAKTGLQVDCLICHGGSIGGQSYVGLGNSTLDMYGLLADMTRAEGYRVPLLTFTMNSSRGTVNAPQSAVTLISFRNPDLSLRRFPIPLGAKLPEMDVPAWWLLKKKVTMYSDGRTDARSVRTSMQFLMGDLQAKEIKALEPTFQDIRKFIESLEPPKYPFPIDAAKAARGERVFLDNCAKCHGTYGEDWEYPNVIVELDRIGTDPARALGISDRSVQYYNATWFGEHYPADEEMIGYQAPPLDGIWATAPYLHNGSVPTLATLLNSSTRPDRFWRPPSTDFDHYDTANVGWMYEEVDGPPAPGTPRPEAMRHVDTTRFGLGNGGHTFGDHLSDEERSDLIEYLKTL